MSMLCGVNRYLGWRGVWGVAYGNDKSILADAT